MPNDPFLLVNLNEDKAKKLAQVIGNPTCVRILDYLAGKDATETQVAQDLKIPLSTVHYNLQQLVQAKLVVIEEFHYSPKGREVNHYKLANKYIIIAPKDDPSFVDRLKKLLPAAVVTLGLAAVLKSMEFFTGTLPAGTPMIAPMPFAAPATDIASEAAPAFAQAAADAASAVAPAMAKSAPQESARAMATIAMGNATNETANQAAVQASPYVSPIDAASGTVAYHAWWQSPMVDWFIVGAACVLLTLALWELLLWWRERRHGQR